MAGKRLAVAVAFSLTLASAGLAQLRPMQMDMSGAADEGIPSYHAYALKPPIPATLDPKQFPDALSRNVYALAAKIKPVLYQQPCYCYCDRAMGHKSLHSCYEGQHAAICSACLKELYYSYVQTKKGKTPTQIRAGITKGEWKQIDLQTAADIN